MKEFNAEAIRFETASVMEAVRQPRALGGYPAYIGLDVHKESIVVAVARPRVEKSKTADRVVWIQV
jgi:hypothetical protein